MILIVYKVFLHVYSNLVIKKSSVRWYWLSFLGEEIKALPGYAFSLSCNYLVSSLGLEFKSLGSRSNLKKKIQETLNSGVFHGLN